MNTAGFEKYNKMFGSYLRVSLCIIWAVFLCFTPNNVVASAVKVEVTPDVVRIVAQEAPLIDVLNELSLQAGFQFESGDPLDKIVSLDLETRTVEECVLNLIRNTNRVLHFQMLADGREVLDKVIILGGSTSATSVHFSSNREQNDERIHFSPDWYAGTLSDSAALSLQLLAKKESTKDIPPDLGGIEVVDVKSGSFFSRIGISKGDIVRNVNGKQITDSTSFINALKWTPGSPNLVRIERLNPEGAIDPIYFYIE